VSTAEAFKIVYDLAEKNKWHGPITNDSLLRNEVVKQTEAFAIVNSFLSTMLEN